MCKKVLSTVYRMRDNEDKHKLIRQVKCVVISLKYWTEIVERKMYVLTEICNKIEEKIKAVPDLPKS